MRATDSRKLNDKRPGGEGKNGMEVQMAVIFAAVSLFLSGISITAAFSCFVLYNKLKKRYDGGNRRNDSRNCGDDGDT